MKIQFDGYEVEIKAKNTERYNTQDTMYLLNEISIWAHEASERYKTLGLCGLSDRAQKSADDIYNILNELHFYDNAR